MKNKLMYVVIVAIIAILALVVASLAFVRINEVEKRSGKLTTKTPFGRDIATARGMQTKSLKIGVVNIHRQREPLDDYDHHNTISRIHEFNESDTQIIAILDSTKDSDSVMKSVQAMLARKDLDAILCIGGTGLSDTDHTVETVRAMAKKEITLFGPYFMQISDVDSTGILGRPAAFMVSRSVDGCSIPVFCIPGHHNAVEVFMRGIFHSNHHFVTFGQDESID